ncbi:glycosyltransferase family 4 protein [Chlorobium sp.]|jgi:glycosyltransferase involved in cell wall biosynthesis|uniref:glycosyltransferase family 4 protein n=1 Tax=Chlorobium sp. TaxID=1095 RepID=UPI003C6230A3
MHITLFFTRKGSLKNWARVGMFEREVALYRKYLEKKVTISFITYGKKDHLLFADRLPGIEILCNEWKLPASIYTRMIPLLHAKTLQKTDIIKSNQTPGALEALRAAKIFRKPMIARCGYMHSDFIAKESGVDSDLTKKALNDELKIFRSADSIEVTTAMMKESIMSRIPETSGKISVVPNYVDTRIFSPSSLCKDIDLLFIGRLTPQKNLFALLDALHGLNLKTVIVGTGVQEKELKAKGLALNLNIDWKGNIPNNELPLYLNRAKLFILPSFYEGHPKTLIESMACALPSIGADSPGIREVIRHGETGWLCSTETGSIREAVIKLSESDELRTTLGCKARTFAVENYSLDTIAEKEHNMMLQLVNRDTRRKKRTIQK